MPPPGGDVIGRRRLDPHLDAFRALGADGRARPRHRHQGARRAACTPCDFFMDEPSVMGTENALMAAAATAGHDRDPQRRLRAARAGPRADAQQDGRGDRGHRLQRHARPRRRDARRLRAHGQPGPHRDRLVHGARGRDRRRAADPGLRRRGPADDPAGLQAPRPATRRWRTATCFVPGGQKLRVERDAGDYQSKVEDGPWPAFPADLTSIAVALATQSEGSVLIFEKMFENRLFFVDKLISMGAEITICDPHRAIVIGPRRLRGARRLLARHPRRHGDADRRRCAPRARARSTTCARSTAATSASTSACGTSARASSASPAGVIHPIPSGTRDVLPDEMRELRAITDGDARRVRRARLRRGRHARARVRGGPDARRPRRGRPRLPAVRRARQRARAALGHDDPDRARGRHALRDVAESPLRFCYLAHAYRAVRQHRGQPREILQAGIELVGAPGPEGTAEAVTRALRGARRRRARRATGSGWATRRCSRALLERAGVPDAARGRRSCTSSPRATSSGSSASSSASAPLGAARHRRSCAAASRCSTACPEAEPLRGAATAGWPPTSRERVIFDLGLVADARLLHGRGLRGLRRRLRRAARRRRALRRPARALRARAARLRLGAGRRARATLARRGGGAMSGLRIAVPRGALLRETLDLLDGLGIDTAEVRANDRKLLFEDAGIVTMRPVRRADLRRGRRRRPRHHRQGRARRAGRARRLRAARPRLRAAARWSSRPSRARTPRPRRCAGSA